MGLYVRWAFRIDGVFWGDCGQGYGGACGRAYIMGTCVIKNAFGMIAFFILSFLAVDFECGSAEANRADKCGQAECQPSHTIALFN